MKLKSRITNYIESQYGAGKEHPWEKYPEFSVFRHLDNHKWFALIMEVRRDVLALSGEGKVDVINLKIDDPVYRDVILQDEGILPGYHMNKAHWITVLLDGTVPEKQIRQLLDISFQTTSSRHRKSKSVRRKNGSSRQTQHITTFCMLSTTEKRSNGNKGVAFRSEIRYICMSVRRFLRYCSDAVSRRPIYRMTIRIRI